MTKTRRAQVQAIADAVRGVGTQIEELNAECPGKHLSKAQARKYIHATNHATGADAFPIVLQKMLQAHRALRRQVLQAMEALDA